MSNNIDKLAHAFNENDNALIATSFDNIPIEKIDWLWHKRIARGKITMIAGEPGLGKSQFTSYLAAQVSNGLKWPDTDQNAPQGDVVILSAEDDPSDTIKPRLIAIGAELKSCHFVEPIMNGKQKSFSLDEDLSRLGGLLEKLPNVGLVVIDPLSAYYGRADSHKDADIRAILSQLAILAAKHNFAVILISHLNKGEKTSPINRVIGSIGAPAASRAVYMIVKDQEQPEKRYFLPVKNNIGNDVDGFSYHIEGVELEEGVETSKICFDEGLVKAHSILHGDDKSQSNGATNAAGEFLLNLLKDGAMLKADIEEEAEGAGYSKSAMQRAKQRLSIKHRKIGFEGGWEWYLTQHAEDAEETKLL